MEGAPGGITTMSTDTSNAVMITCLTVLVIIGTVLVIAMVSAVVIAEIIHVFRKSR